MTDIDVLEAAKLTRPYGVVTSNFIGKIADGFAKSVKDGTVELWDTHDTYIHAVIDDLKNAGLRMAIVQNLRDDVPLRFQYIQQRFTLDEVLDLAIYASAKSLVAALYKQHQQEQA